MDDNKNLLIYKIFKNIFAHGPEVFRVKRNLFKVNVTQTLGSVA
jgi:hypothetical protein